MTVYSTLISIAGVQGCYYPPPPPPPHHHHPHPHHAHNLHISAYVTWHTLDYISHLPSPPSIGEDCLALGARRLKRVQRQIEADL